MRSQNLLDAIENAVEPRGKDAQERRQLAQDVFDEILSFYEQRLFQEEDSVKAKFYEDICLQLKADETSTD